MKEQIAVMVPIIIVVVEFLKKILGEWLCGTKTMIASFVVGAILGLVRASTSDALMVPQGIILGLYAGGIAAGLWSAGKQITNPSQ